MNEFRRAEIEVLRQIVAHPGASAREIDHRVVMEIGPKTSPIGALGGLIKRGLVSTDKAPSVPYELTPDGKRLLDEADAEA